MKDLISYLGTLFTRKRYYKSVSFFSSWDNLTLFPKKVYIAPGVRLNHTIIGKYSRIRHFTTIHHTTIGKFCAIGKNSRIGIARHPTNLISTNLIFYRKNQIKNDWVKQIDFEDYKTIEIGNDVWIGEFATIIGGVKIGDGAIVAARAVVTKDVPPYAIVAGVPAKIVKYRFNEEVIEQLLKIKWWDLDESEIEKKLQAFTIFDISKKELDEYF